MKNKTQKVLFSITISFTFAGVFPLYLPKGENVEVYWGVEDIQTVFTHLPACGATAKMEPTNVGDEIWVATVKDPWGNIFGIIKNPYFKL